MINRGKQFEKKFQEDWERSIKDSFLLRLPDQMSGYKITSSNLCDFICFAEGKLFLIECKSHNGASIPFTAIPQYHRLIGYKDFENVFPGVIVWFKDKDCVLWLPITTLESEYNKGKKSINFKIYEDTSSGALLLPSIKKRVFLDTDYSPLINI